ncbi:hypothetical protein P3T18_003842 [Paraburkholderia sp. GAS199]
MPSLYKYLQSERNRECFESFMMGLAFGTVIMFMAVLIIDWCNR